MNEKSLIATQIKTGKNSKTCNATKKNITLSFSIDVCAIQLTFPGLEDEIEGRGVKACIVCDTPAARINSSRSSVLVLPRALKNYVQNYQKSKTNTKT